MSPACAMVMTGSAFSSSCAGRQEGSRRGELVRFNEVCQLSPRFHVSRFTFEGPSRPDTQPHAPRQRHVAGALTQKCHKKFTRNRTHRGPTKHPPPGTRAQGTAPRRGGGRSGPRGGRSGLKVSCAPCGAQFPRLRRPGLPLAIRRLRQAAAIRCQGHTDHASSPARPLAQPLAIGRSRA